MLGQRLDLILGERGRCVDVAILVAHELKLAHLQSHWLGADTEKPAYVHDNLRRRTCAMQVGNTADLLVFGPVDRGVYKSCPG